VQRRNWELLSVSGYDQYPLIVPAAGTDAIVESVLADDFSLEARESLTGRIVAGVRIFEADTLAQPSLLQKESTTQPSSGWLH